MVRGEVIVSKFTLKVACQRFGDTSLRAARVCVWPVPGPTDRSARKSASRTRDVHRLLVSTKHHSMTGRNLSTCAEGGGERRQPT